MENRQLMQDADIYLTAGFVMILHNSHIYGGTGHTVASKYRGNFMQARNRNKRLKYFRIIME